MSNTLNPATEKTQPLIYHIRIKGHVSREWTDWFSGLTITAQDNGGTCLTGLVVDQAALYGFRRSVRDLAIPLHAAQSHEV